ncbi:hypothetical protein R1sor_013335 [Riccia sorocarpa]|uniref:Uncharacterized protein n=1 Tax=Riccia sorocarpa TaxID=122646 RepID=A0ABD3HAC0_9MARC
MFCQSSRRQRPGTCNHIVALHSTVRIMKGKRHRVAGEVRKRQRQNNSEEEDEKKLTAARTGLLARLRPQVALWKPTFDGGEWLVTGGVLQEGKLVGCAHIKSRYRRFTLAAIIYAWMESLSGESLPWETVDELVMCIAAAFTQDSNNKRRFVVYRCTAGLLGYLERTQLPPLLEMAVKKEFPDEEARYTGFVPDYRSRTQTPPRNNAIDQVYCRAMSDQ